MDRRGEDDRRIAELANQLRAVPGVLLHGPGRGNPAPGFPDSARIVGGVAELRERVVLLREVDTALIAPGNPHDIGPIALLEVAKIDFTQRQR